MEFEKIKSEILELAKEFNACREEYKKAYKSENIDELLSVVKENLSWCVNNKMLDANKLVELFTEEKLNSINIFTTGEHNLTVKEGLENIYTLGSSSANVETWGSSSANVKTLGSSSANESVLSDNSYIRNHNKKTIYIKKDSFNIEYLD